MRVRERRGVAALLVAALVGLAGCTAAEGTKAGGSAPVTTLRVGTNDGDDAPTGAMIAAFADRVAELSDGELVVEAVHEAGRPGGVEQPEWDQRVARMVVAGDLEMGLIPARAWDTEGVTSLRPLSMPMLVDSHDLVEAVVTSDDLAGQLLAGLPDAGVTGLALVPEGLRHAFSWAWPLVSAESFAGTTIRAPRSDTVEAVYRAWGSTAQDLVGQETSEAAASGALAGADSDFVRSAGLGGPAISVAGNLVTSANVHTLVVGNAVLADLSDEHAEVLRQAAGELRDTTLSEWPEEAQLGATYCEHGGQVVTASDADLAALEEAARPVLQDLEQDDGNREVIARIRELAADASPDAPVQACAGAGQAGTAVAAAPDTTGAFPEGVYRAEVGRDAMVAAGATPLEAVNHAGIWTLTFDGGRLTVVDVNDGSGRRSSGAGSYCVAGGRVQLTVGTDDGCSGGQPLFNASWALEDGELRFTDVHMAGSDQASPFADALWADPVWTQID